MQPPWQEHIWAQCPPSPDDAGGKELTGIYRHKAVASQELREPELLTLKIRFQSTGLALGKGEALGAKRKGTQNSVSEQDHFSIQYFRKLKLMHKSLR